MDDFEIYMFDKIAKYKAMCEESMNNKDVFWGVNNCLEELLEIFSHYNLNCKIS